MPTLVEEAAEAIVEVHDAAMAVAEAAEELRAENAVLTTQLEQDAAIGEEVEQILAANGEDLFARLQFATTVLASVATYGGDNITVPQALAQNALVDLAPFVVESATEGRFIAENAVEDAGITAIVELGLAYEVDTEEVTDEELANILGVPVEQLSDILDPIHCCR